MSLTLVSGEMNRMLFRDYAQPRGMANLPDYRIINTIAGCIDSDTVTAEKQVRALLRGEGNAADMGRFDPSATPIRRVEIFCNEHAASMRGNLLDRGIVLFDSGNRPIVHVFHALVGYYGSAPSLTKAIFTELAIPEKTFEEIQALFWGVRTTGVPYYAVVQVMGDDEPVQWGWAPVQDPDRV